MKLLFDCFNVIAAIILIIMMLVIGYSITKDVFKIEVKQEKICFKL